VPIGDLMTTLFATWRTLLALAAARAGATMPYCGYMIYEAERGKSPAEQRAAELPQAHGILARHAGQLHARLASDSPNPSSARSTGSATPSTTPTTPACTPSPRAGKLILYPGWADQTSVNLADFLSALTAWVQRGVASGTIPAPLVSTAIGSYEASPQP
jgi:hypothetical protein